MSGVNIDGRKMGTQKMRKGIKFSLCFSYVFRLHWDWCLFSCQHFEMISDLWFNSVFCDGRGIIETFSWRQSRQTSSYWVWSGSLIPFPTTVAIVLHSHNHDTYTYGNIVNTIMTNGHTSLEKYTSHCIRNGYERVAKGLCVRGELETEQTAAYWPPSSSVFSSTSFSFCWAAQSGVLWAHSPLLGVGSLYLISN